ncbi:unnamed protein product [Camellia sinensis]
MDSQQDGYFTNLLQERPNIDEHYLMESQYLNENTQVFAHESQFTAEIESLSKKPQRGGNFAIEEDKLLVSAGLNISLDAVHGKTNSCMDSQQDGYFTNLLQERPNIDEHYLMESQYLNENTQVFAHESQFTAEIESLSKKP